MLSALDPLGLPLVTQVVAGNAADDPLYLPAIKQVSQSLPGHGVLYVGDCKMAALSTRAYVQAQGDYYLCPLTNTQVPDSELDAYLQPVWNGDRPLLAVHRVTAEGEDMVIAEGYEQGIELSSKVQGQSVTWTERRLVVRSLKQAQAATAALQARLGKAQAALTQLTVHKQGKPVYRDADAVQQAAQAILKAHQVQGLIRLQIDEQVGERPVRAYGTHPAALHFESTGDIDHIDQGNTSYPLDTQGTLRVHLPLLVCCFWLLMRRLRQLSMPLVAAGESSLLEESGHT
jgi:transposase